MGASGVAWSLAGVVGVGGAAGTWSYLHFSDAQKHSKKTGLTYSNLSELTEFEGGECFDNFLSEKEKALLERKNTNDTRWKNLADKPKRHHGCFSVSWDKQTWSNDLWSGIIRYEWIFTFGNETIHVNGLANTATFTQNEQFYIFWKWTYMNKGNGHRVRSQWSKRLDQTNTKKTTPDPLTLGLLDNTGSTVTLPGSEDLEKYWGFNPDYTKVRKRSTLKANTAANKGEPTKVESFSSRWKWTETGGNQKFEDFSKNLYTVFTINTPRVRQAMAKTGTWAKF